MVHAGPPARVASRAMLSESKPRRAVSPLGIPKSPSFHSGLDLVATAAAADARNKRPESVTDLARAFRFALFAGKGGMSAEGQGPPLKATSPPAALPSRDPPPPDKETLMVQLPPLKGQSMVAKTDPLHVLM